MKVTKAEFIISAASREQYPKTQLPEIALAGRSNVGKSSFINRMIGRKSLVRTSAKPGKTRTLNFYNINDRAMFVDVPGYGYAKVSKKEREKWGRMMEEYFEEREVLQVVVLITDLRHKPTHDDCQMYEYVKYLGYPVIVIATKLDKLPKSKHHKQLQQVKQTLNLAEEDVIIPFSAITGEGKELVWRQLKSFI